VSRSILLIDDDPEIRGFLGRFFDRRDWIVLAAGDARSAASLYERERPDLVLLDIQLPDLSGLQLLDVFRARDPDATVIMLTGQADVATAVEAMRLGAENFLTKPVELPHLEAATERALEKVELRRRNRFYSERQSSGAGLDELGTGETMREVARQVELLAASDATVLLLGETGTGKGFISHLLHARSARSANPFVEVNCAGLSATFLDSEIFGHERGAFTDAREQKRGLLEIADTGTFFLDEVGDLAPDLQPKLLKAIESRRFRRLGGTRELEVDVRLIAATNRDLEEAVKTGAFREDLYYRLAVLPVRLPPLRERGRQILADLTLRILSELRRRTGRGPTAVSPEALERMSRYAWPGNIRELRNVLERAQLLAPEADTLRPNHLPPEIALTQDPLHTGDQSDLTLQEVERRHIARVLAEQSGNRSRAARSLGISRATLYEKLERYDLVGIGRSHRGDRLRGPL
jgi:DNA-binding NtrC family response regulator